MSSGCEGVRDFLRQIVNKVFVEASGRLPVSVVEDLKVKFAGAEDKYGFSSFGGDPGRLLDFFSSEDWIDIVEYARNVNALWILEGILKRLEEEYRSGCPKVSDKALELLEVLSKKGAAPAAEIELSLDSIARRLKFYGLKFDVVREGGREYIVVEQPLLKVKMYVSEGKISYEMCKEGKASTIDAILAVMQKLKEL